MKLVKRTYNLLEEELSLIKQVNLKYKEFDLKPNDIIRLGLYCAIAFLENQVKEIAQNLIRFRVGRPKKRKVKNNKIIFTIY